MPNLVDCTDTLRLVYDRGKDGYGVPVPGSRFRGTSKLWEVLMDVQQDLKTIGWWDSIENFLTAGLYVKKPRAHGKGIAIDIDGVVLKARSILVQKILVYKAGVSRWGFDNSNYEIQSLPDRIRTRFDCLMSLRFGVVLTQGYPKHHDHGHYDLSRTVKWRGSRSQVVCLQETLNAWEKTDLKIDGIYGNNTEAVWQETMAEYFHPIDPLNHLDINTAWLDWLKMIAFNPPKDGA